MAGDYFFTIEVGGTEVLSKRLDKIERELLDSALFAEIGEFIKARIKMRTQEGVDYQGSPFEPYSEAYALFREKTGHDSSVVNLFFTGAMQASMQADSSEGGVRVYFLPTTDEKNVRNADKAVWLNTKREFFALSDEDGEMIREMVTEAFREARDG